MFFPRRLSAWRELKRGGPPVSIGDHTQLISTEDPISSVTHLNASLTLEPRRKLVELVVENTWVQARVAARLQVSRATISKWVRRYRAEGMDGLLDHSSRPQPCGGPDCPAHGATHHRFALLLPVGTAPHRLPLAVAAVDGVESGQPLQLCLCWATLT